MIKALLITLITATFVSCSSLEVNQYETTKTYSLDDLDNLSLKASDASIYIIQSDSNELSIKIQSNKQLEVTNTREGKNLNIEVIDPSKKSKLNTLSSNDTSTTITLNLPKTFDKNLILKTSNGKVIGENIASTLDITTSNARVQIENISKKVKIISSNASVFTKNIDSTLDIKTSNGRVEAYNIKGNSNITTSNGSIDTENIKGDLKAKTSNGRIQTENIQGSVELKTSNASIDSQNSSSIINLSTSNGRIDASAKNLAKEGEITSSNGTIEASISNFYGDNVISTNNGSLYLTTEKTNFNFSDFSSHQLKDSEKNITLRASKIKIKTL